jgi:hypothetical protein
MTCLIRNQDHHVTSASTDLVPAAGDARSDDPLAVAHIAESSVQR